ncbi:HNH endonuclease [Flavobacterium johnsoniae]|uniref:Predicted restriction endonuclease n=1 Tax=Flavobacterium johnsoniae TaxID=986 RepID=A0A1M5TJQ9_FLAJO|nr:HNH endonuclease [Flavobacterium johnsoniae]SHH50944.1 Predicted restriction endonuclease [Flavobacterium johnsoniae]
MEDYQKMRINEIEYFIIDSIQDFRAEDSFIHRSNKLAQFDGNGESKKHVGTYKGELGQKLSNFFEYSNWGLEHFDSKKKRKTLESAIERGAVIQDRTCFFSKSNLLKYLDDAKAEYHSQEQIYHNDISVFYDERYNEVQDLDTEYIYFSIYDASDNITQKQNRGYIRSDDKIWKIWRELILPKISYLSILKLFPVSPTEENNKPIFYFRILLDYQFRTFVHPSALFLIEEDLPVVEEIEEIKKSYRIGQERYRRAVIEYMPQCPFSKLTDERILIASHIKPYSVCVKEKREDQALDYLNGLSLSPTYDRLFDQGYITFSDSGELICGTQLSPYTWDKLNINPTAKNKMRIFPENREYYLDYHRRHVFLDDISDLI